MLQFKRLLGVTTSGSRERKYGNMNFCTVYAYDYLIQVSLRPLVSDPWITSATSDLRCPSAGRMTRWFIFISNTPPVSIMRFREPHNLTSAELFDIRINQIFIEFKEYEQ